MGRVLEVTMLFKQACVRAIVRWMWLFPVCGLLAGAGSSRSPDTAEVTGRLRVSCEGGLLSVTAERVSVLDLLDEVGRRCGIGIGYVELPDEEVSAQVAGSMEDGVRELLSQAHIQSYAAIYGAGPDSGDRLERLLVFGSPGRTERSPVALGSPASPQAADAPSVRFPRSQIAERLQSESEVPEGTVVTQQLDGQERAVFLIRSIRREALLSLAGVQAGDVLLNVNGVGIDSHQQLSELLKGWGDGEFAWGLRIDLMRSGQPKMLYLMANPL